MSESLTGIFGKIPAHGDFIERNLPRSFITPWDEWLQRGVASSKELLADQWLETYLTSPIWRFALTSGTLDSSAWAGILVPSVDSVGRYFPVTIARQIPVQSNLFNFLSGNDAWFQALTDSALGALQTPFSADQLLESLAGAARQDLFVGATASTGEFSQKAVVGYFQEDIHQSYSHMLHNQWLSISPSYSVWSCAGSQRMPPTSFAAAGLPTGKQYAALLDGNWPMWGGDGLT